ncbi:type 1 glutamine amidotransferase [Haematospirillum jordaniae]|uniref:type 1 glutamine amidotransferase n=1 Tax=Haematospirillum jordaniae TaxID=1549855 RepID=UPI001432B26D|nr:type 1 glutamine amidotransferase [Haematospirillum jordaniae]NKD86313.1 type 1 glutamine amidotransferase [Haematospirillum jordaniae]
MHIGILETGRPPDELVKQHGSYADMIRIFLAREEPDWSFSIYPVIDDVFPEDVSLCQAWIISGSRHGVYENLPWMVRLKTFLGQAITKSVPIAGICFGHQILAEVMGGVVRKSERGWGIGVQEYMLQTPDSAGNSLQLHAIHQDQVVVCPPGATVLASSSFCPYAMLAYGNKALGIQAHPEFSRDFEEDLLLLRRGRTLPPDLVDQALTRLGTERVEADSAALAHHISAFIKAGICQTS